MYKDFADLCLCIKYKRKEKKVMEQKKTVKLSEGTCCAYCCGDCGWSEPGGDSSGKSGVQEIRHTIILTKVLMDVVGTLQESNP